MSAMWTPTESNEQYMREMAERGRQFNGRNSIRTNNAHNFLLDLADEGVIILIKREIALRNAEAEIQS